MQWKLYLVPSDEGGRRKKQSESKSKELRNVLTKKKRASLLKRINIVIKTCSELYLFQTFPYCFVVFCFALEFYWLISISTTNNPFATLQRQLAADAFQIFHVNLPKNYQLTKKEQHFTICVCQFSTFSLPSFIFIWFLVDFLIHRKRYFSAFIT